MVFKGFLPKFQKNLGFFFFEFSKIPKKPRVFQNSKIPKIFGQVDIDNIFGILEFWKTRGFFLNFVEFQKDQGF